MKIKDLIPANEFCVHHNIEISFISTLCENGLIKVTTIDETSYIHKNQLPELERIICFYSELDINLEGIETIIHLLKQKSEMQRKITELKNRLSMYESVSF
ncbi:MAG: chaperone modulator CbpM [Bacteroidales bacterium]|nr:chaperone modulator CbpM [Bacteroidales bacterium]